MSINVKLTVAEYEALIAQGFFDRAPCRIELIHGELREMSPAGFPHISLIELLTRWSADNTKPPVRISVQSGLSMPDVDSVPEPDLVWIRPGRFGRRRPEPVDILLVIEVADSSLGFDLSDKRDLYATGGVNEYWVFDVEYHQLHVFRRPAQGQFQESFVATDEETIAPLAEPKALLDLGKLFKEALE